MSTTPLERHVAWTSPAPFWLGKLDVASAAFRQQFRRPAILRFATDSFMEEFTNTLAQNPSSLVAYRAVWEDWRHPAPTPEPPVLQSGAAANLARLCNARQAKLAAVNQPAAVSVYGQESGKALKLYQPSHQRYYLVAACLVCRVPGLPDRRLDSSRQERATFVIRRLKPPAKSGITACTAETCDEYAFVPGQSGNAWILADPAALAQGEDQLPLSPMTFTDENGNRRRLLSGLVPVGKRDVYFGAALPSAPDPSSNPLPSWSDLKDPRQVEFKTDVRCPLELLFQNAALQQGSIADSESKGDTTAMKKAAREEIQTASWYLLLDFLNYLKVWMRDVATALPEDSPQNSLTYEEKHFLALLETYSFTPPISGAEPKSLRAALNDIGQYGPKLDDVDSKYLDNDWGAIDSHWPQFYFMLAAAEEGGPAALSAADPAILEKAVVDALNSRPKSSLPPTPPAGKAVLNGANEGGDDLFIIRCVLERPRCGPLADPILGEASEPFQMAGFFDPDAPARPIRIALPVDTTPSGMRKFDKKTMLVMSDILCGQVKKLNGLGFVDLVRAVLPFPLHKDLDAPAMGPCGGPGLNFGMICSLSIPIITICALILLMIMVSLLNMIFNWIPFFMMCLPIPGLKGKKGNG